MNEFAWKKVGHYDWHRISVNTTSTEEQMNGFKNAQTINCSTTCYYKYAFEILLFSEGIR